MLDQAHVPPMSIDSYESLAGAEAVDEIRGLVGPLRDARILHVTATKFRGGAGDILPSLVALMADLGLDVEWRVIGELEDEAFFAAARKLYEGLHGSAVELTEDELHEFEQASQGIAARFEGDYDFVVVHDPQPLPLRSLLPAAGGRWIWRSHLDSTDVDPATWAYLKPLVEAYDAAVFTQPAYAPADLAPERTSFIAPSIDPFSPRNLPLDATLVEEVVYRAGLRPREPLLVQVSRYDHWRDPLGAIDTYRAVKREVPGVQLALLGDVVYGDAESERLYRRAVRAAQGDSDLLVATAIEGIGGLEVNAFQRSAQVVLQKSVREGFGLTVAEALWKGVPVVGGRVGGIPEQIGENVAGRLVESVDEAAAAILELLGDPGLRHSLGMAGRERVRDRYLPTRSLRDYLTLFASLREPEGAAA